MPSSLRRRCVGALVPFLSAISLAGIHAAQAGVEVFTTAGQPVTGAPADAAIVELDAPARLDAEIAADLPDDPAEAERIMRARMDAPEWAEIEQRYGEAYTGLARAWILGITTVPAVVVDGQYVVYGEPDVATALSEIDAQIDQAREEGR